MDPAQDFGVGQACAHYHAQERGDKVTPERLRKLDPYRAGYEDAYNGKSAQSALYPYTLGYGDFAKRRCCWGIWVRSLPSCVGAVPSSEEYAEVTK